MSGARRRFVISHVGRDRPWAEWIAARLVEAGGPDGGVDVRLASWRWDAGQPLSVAVDSVLSTAEEPVDRVVLLFSSALLEAHQYVGDRWPVLPPDFALLGRVIPVRLEPVRLPEPWSSTPGPALYDLGPAEAADRLVTAILGPGEAAAGPAPRLPGYRPDIWNVPTTDEVFVGRDEALIALREAMRQSGRVAVEGLYGMGGVGKTRLALEYAHRFGADYEMVWWVAADRPALIGDQMAALAVRLGLVGPEADTSAAATVARTYLRRRPGWLLVFDNAESAEALSGWLPGGAGHTIITSRNSGWAGAATPMEVDLLTRAESVLLLRRRYPELTMVEAGRLAAVLGDLPLAVVLAVGFLAETQTRPGDYLTELAQHVASVLDEHRAVNYPHALAGALATTSSWPATRDPLALAVARVCAFLAPRPVPVVLLTLVDPEPAGDHHPLAALEGIADGTAQLHRAIGRLQRLGLVQIERVSRMGVGVGDPLNGSNGALTLHRLVATIFRDQLGPDRRELVRAHVDGLLAAADPGDPTDVRRWGRWTLLLPHLYAAEPAHSASPALRVTAVSAARALLARGDVLAARDFVDQLHRRWLERLGPDHEDTLNAARCLAQTLRTLGRFGAAQELDADRLRRRRERLGEDHSDSLVAAADLADDAYALGDVHAACELDEDVLARRTRMYGKAHPSSLSSALRLARDLAALGEAKRAAELRSWVEGRNDGEEASRRSAG